MRWEGESGVTAEEALAAARPAKSGKSKGGPREFLVDVLINGPVLRNTIVERGAEHGFSYEQLNRALKALGGEAFKKEERAGRALVLGAAATRTRGV